MIMSKNIETIINQLEELVNSAKSMPFANKVLIDDERVRDIIEDMRKNLPEEIKRARYIDNDKDKILSEARKKADDLVSTAENRSNSLVRTAEERSKELVDTSNAKANEILTNAKEQAKNLINENSITQEALKKAELIINTAQKKAEEITTNAQKRADKTINTAENNANALKTATNEYILKNLTSSEAVLKASLEGIVKTKDVILKANHSKNNEPL